MPNGTERMRDSILRTTSATGKHGHDHFHLVSSTILWPALSGVWIEGVWNGHFPESEKYFSEAEFSRKIPEIPQSNFCRMSGSRMKTHPKKSTQNTRVHLNKFI